MKDLLIKSIKDLNFIAIIAIALWCNAVNNFADFDFWSRLYCGLAYINNGWILTQDIFAFAETKAYWVDHEWLSGIIFFLIFKQFGSFGILLLKWSVVITCITFIYLCLRLRNDSNINIIYLFIILFGIETAFLSNIRPHIFTYVFFCIWLFILEYSRLNNSFKYLYILPLSIVLWVNLHAGCIAGIALCCVYALSQIIEKKEYKYYIIVAVVSVLLMLINPYGYNYFGYILAELAAEHNNISEWESVNLFDFSQFVYFKILFILTIIGFIFSKARKTDPLVIILLLSLAYFAFSSGRHTVLFVIVSGVFCYEHLLNIYNQLTECFYKKLNQKNEKLLNFLLDKGLPLIPLILCICILSTFNLPAWKLDTSGYPISSIKFIKNNDLKGNLLLPFYWGGFATWNLYPDVQVSTDGRYVEIFSEETFNKFNSFFFNKSDNSSLIGDYKIDIILLDRHFKDVYDRKINKSKWKSVYKDEISEVLMPANKAITRSLKKPRQNN